MALKFIKKTMSIAIVFIATLLLTMNLIHPKASGQIQFLTANVGETYDKIGINYHCSEDNSYVLYGTSKSGNTISNPTKVEATSTLWSYESTYSGSGTPDNEKGYKFAERYVCKANLTNLLPNTTYYYQAVSATASSEIQTFTTTSNDASRKSFLFLTDIQSSGQSFKNANTLIEAIEHASNTTPNLVVMTGDQVDRGGIEQQWIDYYEYIPLLHNKLHASVPGNHEYYLTSGAGYVDNSIYNQFNNNPMNGPADRLGSSYYFVWDQILFIMLDTVKRDYDVEAQQQWFRDVVKNNPSQWIIVGSHPGLYATGAYAEDAKTMRRNWLKVFEECQVDLALNGHEHVYCRKNNRYNGSSTSPTAGEVDEELGVTYLQGAAAGLKSYSDQMQNSLVGDFDKVLKGNNNMGVLVNVESTRLIIKCYMASGQVVDEFTLSAKRPSEISTVNKETIEESIQTTYSKETNSISVSWTPELYGNASSIDIAAYTLGNEHLEIANTSTVIASAAERANTKVINNIFDNYNYVLNITIHMRDGSTIEKEIPVIVNESLIEYTINYELDGSTNGNNPTKYNTGNLPIKLEDPTKLGYRFDGWYNKETGRKVREIKEGTTGDLTLVAKFTLDTYTITYSLDGGTLPSSAPTTYSIVNIPTLVSPTKEGYTFSGWTLNGTTVNELPSDCTGDITLTATFTANKKNCKKSSIVLIMSSITLLASAFVIFRKKH